MKFNPQSKVSLSAGFRENRNRKNGERAIETTIAREWRGDWGFVRVDFETRRLLTPCRQMELGLVTGWTTTVNTR